MKRIRKSIFAFLSLCMLAGCGQQAKTSESEEISEAEEVSAADMEEASGDGIRIEIYSENSSATLEKAAELFRETYPDVMLDFEIGEEDQTAETRQALESGENAPDLIVLDGMDFETEALSTFFSPIEKDTFSEGTLIRAFQKRNGYSVPLRGSVPLLFVKDSAFSTLEGIRENMSRFSLIDLNKEEVLELFYRFYSTEFLKEDGSLDSENLEEFLETVKAALERIETPGQVSSDEEYVQIKKFLLEDQSVMGHYGTGIQDLNYYLNAAGQVQGRAVLVEGLRPVCEIAVNKNSPYQEECMNFIRTALSMEIQGEDLSDGFPVLTEALDEWATAYEKGEAEISLGYKDEKEVTLSDAPEVEIQNLVQLIKDTEEIYERDETLLKILKEEAKNYLSGVDSLEETVEAVILEYN